MSLVSDAIKNEISILDYAQKYGYTPVRAGRQYSLREHDSVRIDPERNIFYRHSTGKGGSVIDFAMFIHNVDTVQAISMLRKELDPASMRRSYPKKELVAKPKELLGPLELPEQIQGRFTRVAAYLHKSRGIDNAIINDMISRKQLYEDTFHNCVFVGFDARNTPAFGCARGTSTYREKPFRRDYENSRKEVGFYVNNNASRLFVCEAPIDALSLMTLLKKNKMDYKKYDYLAVSGVCYDTLPYHLARIPPGQLKTIYLATDNDTKGEQARKAYRAQLQELGYQGKIIDKIPVNKDWNVDLATAYPVPKEPQAKPKIQSNQSKPTASHQERSLSL